MHSHKANSLAAGCAGWLVNVKVVYVDQCEQPTTGIRCGLLTEYRRPLAAVKSKLRAVVGWHIFFIPSF
jgi:hypothetical protein